MTCLYARYSLLHKVALYDSLPNGPFPWKYSGSSLDLICSMMRGPRVFFPGGLGLGQGTRDSFVCAEGREGVAYFWFISNKFEFSGRNPVPLSPSRSAHYCVTDHVRHHCVIVI